jgi:hypothetical protein
MGFSHDNSRCCAVVDGFFPSAAARLQGMLPEAPIIWERGGAVYG